MVVAEACTLCVGGIAVGRQMIIPVKPKDLFIVKLILLHHHALRCCLEGFLQKRAGKCTAILGKGIALQIRAGQGAGIVGRGAALQIKAGKGAAILGKGLLPSPGS